MVMDKNVTLRPIVRRHKQGRRICSEPSTYVLTPTTEGSSKMGVKFWELTSNLSTRNIVYCCVGECHVD